MSFVKWNEFIRENKAIILLLFIFSIWYSINLHGAMEWDEIIYVTSGFNLLTRENLFMWAETPQLGKYLIGLGYMLGGNTAVGARSIAMLFSLMSIYITYTVGKDLNGKVTGLLSALLLGLTKIFAVFSVKAKLEIFITFFVILLIYLTLKFIDDKNNKKIVFAIGFVSFCILSVKMTGIIFIIIPVLLVLYVNFKNHISTSGFNSPIIFFLLGFVLSFLIIYFPYLQINPELISSEIARSGRDLDPQLERFLINGPIFFYLFGKQILGSLIIMGADWSVCIAGNFYKNMPYWAYFYWLWVIGGIFYLTGLISSINSGFRKNLNQKTMFLIIYLTLSFLLLSLLGAKRDYFLMPLLPFVSIISIISIKFMLKKLIIIKNYKYRRLVIILSIIFLLMVPTAPIYSLISGDGYQSCLITKKEHFIYSINTDSGYDRVAHFLSKDEFKNKTVLADMPIVLEYYAKKDRSFKIFSAYLCFYDQYLINSIHNGSIDIIVLFEDVPCRKNSEIMKYINENYVTIHRIEGNLVIKAKKSSFGFA